MGNKWSNVVVMVMTQITHLYKVIGPTLALKKL